MNLIHKILSISLSLIFINSFFYSCFAENELADFEASVPSAVLIEANSGKVLFEKNPHEVRYAASLMKIMNLILAFEALEEGKINLNDKVTIKEDSSKVEGSNIHFSPSEALSVEDLIKAISMVSANDASIALAERISGSEEEFINQMNKKALDLKLKNTIFKNCTGSDIDGNASSAQDIATMAQYLIECKNSIPYFSKWIDHIRDGKTQLVNTNKLLKIYPDTIGIKTGTSKEAGSCVCAYAIKNNLKLIAVVLGCNDIKERNKQIVKLLDYGFSTFSLITPEIPNDLPKFLKVKNGMSPEVEIAAVSNESFPIEINNSEKISSEIILEEPIEAPIEVGKKVGKIIYKQGSEPLCTIDVISRGSVPSIDYKLVTLKLINSFLRL